VSKDVPLQLSESVTTGAAGTVNGAADPVPAALVEPLTVAVTLYVPVAVTVMEEVVAPVLHNKEPVAVVDNFELPQLLTSVTVGVGVAAERRKLMTVKRIMAINSFRQREGGLR
jgi:hypothetical protein